MLAAVILGAGESTRMGSPKALALFRGRTFLERLLQIVAPPERLAASGHPQAPAASNGRIGCVRVVLGAYANEICEKLALDPSLVLLNPDWRAGQLSSIQAVIRGLLAAPDHERLDGMLLFLVDHPLVSRELVEELIRRFYESSSAIVVPSYRGKRGHPVIFARRLFSELLDAPPDQGARSVVWTHAAEVLEVQTDEEGVVLNLNDPESLRRAEERV